MKESLEKAITQFQEARTSLEAYRAISNFVQIILTLPKFIKAIEDEGEKINFEQRKLNADKGHDLRWSELKRHNEWRAKKSEALHQLDPYFPFINLYQIHMAIQPDEIVKVSNGLFNRFGPDDPLPLSDRSEFQGYLDKLYGKVSPHIAEEPVEQDMSLRYDPERCELFVKGKLIKISLKHDKPNAHIILNYLFSIPSRLTTEHFFSDIAEIDTPDNWDKKNSWRKYHRASVDINEKIRKQAKFDDFLVIKSGNTGSVKISEKYRE
jgi:hypothetical protein